MPQILKLSDIVILPSLAEGLGNVILEGMASGKAVIASDVGGIKESVIDKDNGLLIKPGSVKDIVESVLLLSSDFKLRNKLAENALARIRAEFDIRQVAKNWEDFYDHQINSLNKSKIG